VCFIMLIHGIFEGCLGSLLIVRPGPRRSVVDVGWEDCFRTIDHEERRVAGRLAGGLPQGLEYRGKLRSPSSAEFV
jgi:hypothetical protein